MTQNETLVYVSPKRGKIKIVGGKHQGCNAGKNCVCAAQVWGTLRCRVRATVKVARTRALIGRLAAEVRRSLAGTLVPARLARTPSVSGGP